MANRVERIALQVQKLAQATGIEDEKEYHGKDSGLDGVTSDLDIEALSKGLIDITKDFDVYLQSLLDPPNMPTANLKAVSFHGMLDLGRASIMPCDHVIAQSTCSLPHQWIAQIFESPVFEIL